MRGSVKVRFRFFLYFAFCLLPAAAYGEPPAAAVKNAALSAQDDGYVLSADIGYVLSASAMKALQNGVPLFWELQIKVQQHRDYFWNKTVVEKKIRYRIQYHALLNMYRVIDENSRKTYNFSSLAAALELMSAVRDFRLMDKADMDTEHRYIAGIRVKFDRESLPLPLRPIAYINPQWYLSSDWYLWSLTK